MKSTFVIFLLLCSLAIATLQFARKMHSLNDGIDLTINSLKGLENVLQPGAKISLYAVNTPGEIPFWASYALAPRYLSTDKRYVYDTALIITTGGADSLLTNKKIIWQNADSQFHYFLTCTQH